MKDKIELKIFSNDYVDYLLKQVEVYGKVEPFYTESPDWEEKTPRGRTNLFLPTDFKLKMPEGSQISYDLENSISLYEKIVGINETIASDPRLWTWLSHIYFWDYMRARWPVEGVKNPIGRITDRYYMKYLKLESLVRHGISRLWWYAHLTCDENRDDKYELTRILLSKADITVGIMERSLGSNKNIRTALLEILSENPEISEKEDEWRKLFISVNLLGGVKNLPFLSVEEIKTKVIQII